MSKTSFELWIPPESRLQAKIEESLADKTDAQFVLREYGTLLESSGSGLEVLAYIFSFGTASALAACLKYAAPVLIEFLRSRSIRIEVDGQVIHVANQADLERATKAVISLSKEQAKQRPK